MKNGYLECPSVTEARRLAVCSHCEHLYCLIIKSSQDHHDEEDEAPPDCMKTKDFRNGRSFEQCDL